MITTTIWLFFLGLPSLYGFVSQSPVSFRRRPQFSPSLSGGAADTLEGPILTDIPAQFHPLFLSAENATLLRQQDTTKGAHDPFRYEWGTWVREANVEYLMEQMNLVRVNDGAYQKMTGNRHPRRMLVASGDQWECFLHCLPKETTWQGQWPTGSWTVLKPLTGVAEIASMKGPDRNGVYTKKTSKDIRGGSDGSFAGGTSTSGDDPIKYIGGALRRYVGKAGKTVLMEIIIRPPVKYQSKEVVESLTDFNGTFTIVEPPAPEEETGGDEQSKQNVEAKATNEKNGAHLGNAMGMSFEQVGGLDAQLDAIARRVLASRANPEAARRLGVNHVRGILLSGPPGCGKTLLARELANLLGAREPQIVNGPEILDKFIGEAEKKIRELFLPAEREYRELGDNSALHIIILDEMDAIARKRGSMSSDTTGVRDSVVNQLLAKMDGVKEANNVLVVGLTNRPELLDPALLRPGRLEVQLRVELPDLSGRRDILRIHTRRMREAGALSKDAINMLEDLGDRGIAAKSEHFSGAELAGLIRSAASFALARTVEDAEDAGIVSISDINSALGEIVPALGKQDGVLKARYPFGISNCSSSIGRVMRDISRFITPTQSKAPRVQSMLLVGAGGNGGSGVTALAAWGAAEASEKGFADYVRFVTSLDLLGDGRGGDEARAAALIDQFAEAKELQHSLLVLDDIDQICAGSGPNGYSSIMISTLRALLREPPTSKQAGEKTQSKSGGSGKTLQLIAATSRSDAACSVLNDLFEETVVVPLLSDAVSVKKVLADSPLSEVIVHMDAMSEMMIRRLTNIGCKTVLRLAELAVATASRDGGDNGGELQLESLSMILEDLVGDEVSAKDLCEVIY